MCREVLASYSRQYIYLNWIAYLQTVRMESEPERESDRVRECGREGGKERGRERERGNLRGGSV